MGRPIGNQKHKFELMLSPTSGTLKEQRQSGGSRSGDRVLSSGLVVDTGMRKYPFPLIYIYAHIIYRVRLVGGSSVVSKSMSGITSQLPLTLKAVQSYLCI